ncbi:2-oxoglutarate and iron-dependent oxygenase domain-containing protein 1 [Paramicrosporidium saccamoebae]|uniref:2-oxoglutarate and iron-dependent oxygenase domain-containing protein 1 n=1 Tax=Paramicrosporidium saccamoebae TaxID=1246581 RepID=A0A2H9TLE3_9FUNG|nr:2-oxoglutarate and iron-dependent oxygenase domain-containing protein 1 [Paramicrosporidium saccamoebae]
MKEFSHRFALHIYDGTDTTVKDYCIYHLMINPYIWEAAPRLEEPFRKRSAYTDKETDAQIVSEVYPVVKLPNFLTDPSVVRKQLSTFTYRQKETDLYRFSQTGDLNGVLGELREALLGFIPTVEKIVGRALHRTNMDLSSQCYGQDEYLLGHDDRLDSRRVAFVLYLMDEWTAMDGGALQFVPTDWRTAPTNVAIQSIVPAPNLLVFFEVSKSSHHQVAQVLGTRKRLSVAGWFHDAETPTLSVPSNEIGADLLMEMSTYATFRNPDTVHITTKHESFHYFQESSEPRWMRQLMAMENNLEWPSRPVMKQYRRNDYRQPGPDMPRIFVFVRDCNEHKAGTLLYTTRDLTIPLNTETVIVEIC